MADSENVTDGTTTAGEVRSRLYERGSGRDRVLDAYAKILLEEGVAAATLDEVAHQADISKGGLLHHFASKEALVDGLLERLVEYNAEDIEQTRAAGPDVVEAYLTSSTKASDRYSVTLMAVMRLAGAGDDRVDAAIQKTEKAWYDMLLEYLGDPLKARVVQLIGDGYYFNALIGNSEELPDDVAVREFLRTFVNPA